MKIVIHFVFCALLVVLTDSSPIKVKRSLPATNAPAAPAAPATPPAEIRTSAPTDLSLDAGDDTSDPYLSPASPTYDHPEGSVVAGGDAVVQSETVMTDVDDGTEAMTATLVVTPHPATAPIGDVVTDQPIAPLSVSPTVANPESPVSLPNVGSATLSDDSSTPGGMVPVVAEDSNSTTSVPPTASPPEAINPPQPSTQSSTDGPPLAPNDTPSTSFHQTSTVAPALVTTQPPTISLHQTSAEASVPALVPKQSTTVSLHQTSTEAPGLVPTQPPTISLHQTSPEAPGLVPTQPPTISLHQTSAASQVPAVPADQDSPSELNVGDDDFKGPHHHTNSPLDPLLAGLVSVFIVTTAIISVVLFLKLRQRTDHPEFHRLQDLPMDDLMEDTPLSRYPY